MACSVSPQLLHVATGDGAGTHARSRKAFQDSRPHLVAWPNPCSNPSHRRFCLFVNRRKGGCEVVKWLLSDSENKRKAQKSLDFFGDFGRGHFARLCFVQYLWAFKV